MKTLPTIQLERLTLRPFSLDDAQAVQAMAGDPYVAEMTMNIPHPYEDGMAEGWIQTHLDHFNEERSLQLAIVLSEEQQLIGAIGIAINKKFAHGELGYWIGKSYINHGYCTEAARGIVKYAFTELNLHRVYACHLGKNPASGKVMEKLGMKYEGLLRQHIRKWDQFEDLVHYGLLKDEFLLSSHD
ncbi:GNAT family N-acetyltransferase [Paenibacillus sp. HJL G12]|uniref:GNAT family N-acetyltransferase n=1 Tax=Paenibacillus dendrobii TaxID=2691084 RepID=A0A7X3LGQ7_9BACL|nr:GNAT family N-acetyltransferase [Paenibacillus dendrobii]MWV42743.1 GNAT family N-acetyltransferase [Paenibacillus dendrobii]